MIENNHRYYFINRPPSYGARPDGAIEFRVWLPSQQVREVDNRFFLGYADYPQPLSPKDVWNWELIPADENERNAYNEWRDENNC